MSLFQIDFLEKMILMLVLKEYATTSFRWHIFIPLYSVYETRDLSGFFNIGSSTSSDILDRSGVWFLCFLSCLILPFYKFLLFEIFPINQINFSDLTFYSRNFIHKKKGQFIKYLSTTLEPSHFVTVITTLKIRSTSCRCVKKPVQK